MLNGISEKGLGKPHKVTVENCLGGRSNTVVKNLDQQKIQMIGQYM